MKDGTAGVHPEFASYSSYPRGAVLVQGPTPLPSSVTSQVGAGPRSELLCLDEVDDERTADHR